MINAHIALECILITYRVFFRMRLEGVGGKSTFQENEGVRVCLLIKNMEYVTEIFLKK